MQFHCCAETLQKEKKGGEEREDHYEKKIATIVPVDTTPTAFSDVHVNDTQYRYTSYARVKQTARH